MKTILLAFCLLMTAPVLAKEVPLQTAVVVSQNIGAYRAGAAVLPMGSGLIGVPITRAVNTVVLQTPTQRITLLELTGRHFLVLPVNGTVFYYVDGDRYILVDTHHKKHKFSLLHLENIP